MRCALALLALEANDLAAAREHLTLAGSVGAPPHAGWPVERCSAAEFVWLEATRPVPGRLGHRWGTLGTVGCLGRSSSVQESRFSFKFWIAGTALALAGLPKSHYHCAGQESESPRRLHHPRPGNISSWSPSARKLTATTRMTSMTPGEIEYQGATPR